MTSLPNPNPDFRITGPGLYIYRNGEKHRIEHYPENYPNEWKSDDGFCYQEKGIRLSGFGVRTREHDIIAKAPTAAGEGLPSPIVAGSYRTPAGKAWVAATAPEASLNGRNEKWPVMGIAANGCYEYWTLSGEASGGEVNRLIAPWREPVVVDRFINIYHDYEDGWESRAKANARNKRSDRIACIHIRITGDKVEIIPENGDE